MRRHKGLWVTEALLALLALVLVVVMMTTKQTSSLGRVALILPQPDADRWQPVKAGLKQATRERDLDVFTVDTPLSMSPKQELALMKRVADQHVNAIVVAPSAAVTRLAGFKQLTKRLPVTVLDAHTEAAPCVGPDQLKMSQAVLAMVKTDFKARLRGLTIGVVGGQLTPKDRKALKHQLDDLGIRVGWQLKAAPDAALSQALADQPPVAVLVGLDNASLITTARYAKRHQLPAYGIGWSAEVLVALDQQVLSGIVVPDQFQVGYTSGTQTADRLRRRFLTPAPVTVPYTTLRADTLFDRANQEMLFMLNQ